MIYCEERTFCQAVTEKLAERTDQTWLKLWQSLNAATKRGLTSIRDEEELSEGKIFLLLNELMPANSTLFTGNSMPIRDLDTFFFTNDKEYYRSWPIAVPMELMEWFQLRSV